MSDDYQKRDYEVPYEAPTVSEDTLDAGGNYVPVGRDDNWGTLGSTGDPQ